jgi:hypothetical protein
MGDAGREGGSQEAHRSTLTPCCAAKYAAVNPAAPAPTISKSGEVSAAAEARQTCRCRGCPVSRR